MIRTSPNFQTVIFTDNTRLNTTTINISMFNNAHIMCSESFC